MSKTTTLLAGLAGLILLTWIAIVTRQPAIEQDLVERVTQQLAAHAIERVSVVADGRDLSLQGQVGRDVVPDYVGELAAEVWGVRTVDVSGLNADGTPGASDPLTPDFDTTRIKRLGGDLSNPLSVPGCQRAMARLASASNLRFPVGSASPTADSYPVLNDLATVLYQCPDADVVIGSHTDGDDDRELALSRARADAIERFFRLAGIEAERMQVVAYGDSQPVAGGDTPDGGITNQRITLDVLARE